MWLYNGKLVEEKTSWVDEHGIRHPPNWNSVWSDADKINAGMKEVADVEKPSETFYKDIIRNEDGTYSSTELGLEELKTQHLVRTKNAARTKRAVSDWQIIAKTERDRKIDEATATYRAAVRSACDSIETKISSCNSLDEFKALFVTPEDGNAPIHDWPKL